MNYLTFKKSFHCQLVVVFQLAKLHTNRVEQDTNNIVSPPPHTTVRTGRYTAVR
jgi:hypothetical protein